MFSANRTSGNRSSLASSRPSVQVKSLESAVDFFVQVGCKRTFGRIHRGGAVICCASGRVGLGQQVYSVAADLEGNPVQRMVDTLHADDPQLAAMATLDLACAETNDVVCEQ